MTNPGTSKLLEVQNLGVTFAMASGPLLNAAGAVLSDAFGSPIDFSPVIGASGGTAAVAAHQFGTQRRRARAGL